MDRLRVLVLGPKCDPESISISFVTYCHVAALARLHDVTLVVSSSVEEPVKRAGAPFHAIEVVHTPLLDRIYAWIFRWILRQNYDSQIRTALGYPFSIAFEWNAWRQLKRRIAAGEYDVVLRLMPMTPVLPSPFAYFLRNGPVPFVLGPLNGGLPWPSGFSQLVRQKEWIARFRKLYRIMPFARSTYRYASAIIAASSQTYSEFTAYHNKLFFVPEPGIDCSACCNSVRKSEAGRKLDLLFVGGLVPRKACDLALRAAASLLRKDLARFTVIGNGPERERLEQLTRSLGIERSVSFCGVVSHAEVFKHMRCADVFVFPTLRDNGAGVVFEALASGAVPVVVDFGGPGDIVHPQVGYKVPLTNEDDIVSRIETILVDLADDRDLLNRLKEEGVAYARECLTWDAKAKRTAEILMWVVQRGPRPDLLPPKDLWLRTAQDPMTGGTI